MEIVELSDNYMGSNTYILKENDMAIVIDAGVGIEEIERHIEPDTRVLGLFITHAHFDHIMFVDEYISTFNCPLLISEKGAEKLYDGDKNLSKQFLGIDMVLEHDYNMEIVHDKDVFDFENIKIVAYELKGHSDCSFGYKVGKNLFSGDVIFENNSVGRTDMYSGDSEELMKSISKIKSLDIDTIYAGHGKKFCI